MAKTDGGGQMFDKTEFLKFRKIDGNILRKLQFQRIIDFLFFFNKEGNLLFTHNPKCFF